MLVPTAPILTGQPALFDGAEQLTVAEQRAFGKAGGAAGVKLQRDIIRGDGGHDIISDMARNPLGKGRAALERRIEQDHGLQIGRGSRFVHQRQETGFRNDDADARIRQDIGDFARHQPGIDRHQHRTQPETGAHQRDIIGMVQRQPANPVTLPHPGAAQRRHRLQHAFMQIAIAPHRAVHADGRLVGRAGGMMPGQRRQGREIAVHAGPPRRFSARGGAILPLSIAGSSHGL